LLLHSSLFDWFYVHTIRYWDAVSSSFRRAL
jgi:hypothetical protein